MTLIPTTDITVQTNFGTIHSIFNSGRMYAQVEENIYSFILLKYSVSTMPCGVDCDGKM
jgi:hypothetical protein